MSNKFNTHSEKKTNTWVVWFIVGICLTVALENPIFLILGVTLAIAHKTLLQENRD